MKRFMALLLTVILLVSCFPAISFAKSKQMNDGVPVWTEETVRQYALDYISGTQMSKLWNYYDLQIRRYMPQRAFECFLIDLEFLTGDFQNLGSYRSFEEPENELKTHVLHLCMERQDVDMYFTHKNKEDDWEVMALEFVLAEEEVAGDLFTVAPDAWTETNVTVGTAQYPLEGILTVPSSASVDSPAVACVFVHDFGAFDRNLTQGKTAMFKDFAEELAEMGIASLRYDKRTFTYPDAQIETVWDETIEDALSAVDFLLTDERFDRERIVVVGVGLGAMLAPRIASQSEGDVKAMIMIGGVLDSLLDVETGMSDDYFAALTEEEAIAQRDLIRNFRYLKEADSHEQTLLGKTAYYYLEADQYGQAGIIRKLQLPVFIAQGKRDPIVSEEVGRQAYLNEIGYSPYAEYEAFRGLNHLLMDDLTVNGAGKPEYSIETHVDKHAARTLANWMISIGYEDE